MVKPYVIGDMTTTVYPVNGGLEDWSYGCSWDTKNCPICRPKEQPAYSLVNEPYGKDALRNFIYLVEASNYKSPDEVTLGTVNDVEAKGGANDGFVSRNIRMSIDFAKMVVPYIMIEKFEYDPTHNKMIVEYKAGGCFHVNYTTLQWGYVKNNSNSQAFWKAPNSTKVDVNYTKNGYFANPNAKARAEFTVTKPSEAISLKIILNCDKNWGNSPDKQHILDPQSNLVRMRTRMPKNTKIENNGWYVSDYSQYSYLANNIVPENLSKYQLDFTDKNQ